MDGKLILNASKDTWGTEGYDTKAHNTKSNWLQIPSFRNAGTQTDHYEYFDNFIISNGVIGNGGNDCFITTAAYGSIKHPYLNILGDFRDRYILRSNMGAGHIENLPNNTDHIETTLAISHTRYATHGIIKTLI